MSTPGTYVTPWYAFRQSPPLVIDVQAAIDAAQAVDVLMEAEDQRLTALRLRLKTCHRRAARHLAQIQFGERMQAMQIHYTPEYDNLFVERGDGTLPEHWAMQFHGFLYALGAGNALVVWLPGEDARYFEVWDLRDLGRAVKRLAGRV